MSKRQKNSKGAFAVFLVLIGSGLICCAERTNSSIKQYYHGPNMPASFFKVITYNPEMIWFEIRCDKKLVPGTHVILDGNDVIAWKNI